MTLTPLRLGDALNSLPPEWPDSPLDDIRRVVSERGDKLVVLDDDPTGTQTVHDVPVLADWAVDSLASEHSNGLAAFYVLTNTRSMTAQQARRVNSEVGRNLMLASKRCGKRVTVVSRGDSTLRGHFPAETDALAGALGNPAAPRVLVPFFLEGGRYTIGNVHYVAEGDTLVPAGQTEFARDPTFGYSSSDLRAWVHEKTEGAVKSSDVASVSIDDLRRGGPEAVRRTAESLLPSSVCVVNAASMRDLEVAALGFLLAERVGRSFVYRTAASFIRARLGQEGRALLTKLDLGIPDGGGGLIIVGSHVPRTTSQLEHLLAHADVHPIEIDVELLLDARARDGEIQRIVRRADNALVSKDVVMYTKRRLVLGKIREESLVIARRVSEGVVETIRGITARPRYILAKGGITSSDIATKALNVSRAVAPGQVLPGVPVWELGPESKYPGLKYVVFPGNVGGPDALSQVVNGFASVKPRSAR